MVAQIVAHTHTPPGGWEAMSLPDMYHYYDILLEMLEKSKPRDRIF